MSNRSRYQIADNQQYQSVVTSDADLNASPPDPRTVPWDLLSYRAPIIDDDGRECDRYPWMQVSVHAQEVLRNNVAPAPTAPLTAQQIRTAGQLVSLLGARLVLSDDTQESRVVDVDLAGGFTFTWAGSGVGVKVLTQANGAPIREIPAAGLTGVIVVDTIVGASATVAGVGNVTGSGGGGSLSPSCLKLSQSKSVPLAGGQFFEVPSGACRATIYANDPLLTGDWLAYYQGPDTAPVVAAGLIGTVPVAALASAIAVDVPGLARALAVVNGAPAAQIVTVVWDIML